MSFVGIAGTNQERTFIAIKPDGVQRGLIGEIISRFERKGYTMVAMKLVTPSVEHAKEHYAELSSRPNFGELIAFFSSGPVVAMVWEGAGVIKGGRAMIGATSPADSPMGSIRGDLAVETSRNVIHGSDSPASAAREIALWFTPEEVTSWKPVKDAWVYKN